METIKAELGKIYTIVGRQEDRNYNKVSSFRPDLGTRTFRNRYPGVNDHGGACVLTMGERRTYRCRAYFDSYEMARDFYEKFVEKFSHREDTKFEIKKVSGNNPVIGAELVLDQSDCGPYYHVSKGDYGVEEPVKGIHPTSNGKVSWERDDYKREN